VLDCVGVYSVRPLSVREPHRLLSAPLAVLALVSYETDEEP